MSTIQEELAYEQAQCEKGSTISQNLNLKPGNTVFGFFQPENNHSESDSDYSIQECNSKLSKNTKKIPKVKESQTLYEKENDEIDTENNIPTENSVSEIDANVDINQQILFNKDLTSNQQKMEESFSKIAQLEYQSSLTSIANEDNSFLGETLASIPSNTFFEKKIKEKEHKKVTNFLNKTISTNGLKNFEIEWQDNDEDRKMLHKISNLKKVQSYGIYKEWEAHHIEQMDFHISMINLLLNEVDLRVSSSTENLQVYERYFQDRLRQQQRSLETQVINIQNCLKKNPLTLTSYQKISNVIFRLNKCQTQKTEKIRDFCDLINQILKDLIQSHFVNSKKQLMTIREKISTKKSLLKKCSQNVEQTNIKMNKSFCSTQCEQPVDIHTQMRKLARRVIKEAVVQKQLAELALQYYQEAVSQDKMRIQIIRESWLRYSKGLNQTYHIQIDKEEIEQMTKMEEQNLIDMLYSIQSLFSQPLIKLFKSKLNLGPNENFTYQNFQKFLRNFKIKKFNSDISVLKKYEVTIVNHKNLEKCIIVITVDNYLLFFMRDDEQYADSCVSFMINDPCLTIKSTNSTTVQIVKQKVKKASVMDYFWDSKDIQRYNVSFLSRDSKDQFMDTLKNIINK